MTKNIKTNCQNPSTEHMPGGENKRPWRMPDNMTWLFLGGLSLMIIALFLSPESLDAFANFFKRIIDIRRRPLRYFIVIALTCWFAYKWYKFDQGAKHDAIQQMNQENKPSENRKRRGMPFVKYTTICLVLGVMTYRVVFDWNMYFYGETLEIRQESRSGYDYLLRLPPGYNAFSGKRPLLIYLHGAGETGKDLAVLKKSDPSVWAHNYVEREEYPFITVTPVTAIHGWNPERLKILVEELLLNRDRFTIDETRIYLTGYSMGGFGTFETAEKFPELFAAIVPVAGGGKVERAKQLKNMPTWAFHGDKDTAVSYSHSKEMIDAIEKSGNEHARLTTYHGAGHGIVADVYRNPKLYQWLLQYNTSKHNK